LECLRGVGVYGRREEKHLSGVLLVGCVLMWCESNEVGSQPLCAVVLCLAMCVCGGVSWCVCRGAVCVCVCLRPRVCVCVACHVSVDMDVFKRFCHTPTPIPSPTLNDRRRRWAADNKLGPDGGRALAEALKVNTTLTTLDLGDNEVGVEVRREIDERLRANETRVPPSDDTDQAATAAPSLSPPQAPAAAAPSPAPVVSHKLNLLLEAGSVNYSLELTERTMDSLCTAIAAKLNVASVSPQHLRRFDQGWKEWVAVTDIVEVSDRSRIRAHQSPAAAAAAPTPPLSPSQAPGVLSLVTPHMAPPSWHVIALVTT